MEMPQISPKFFLYARKSTDVEDKQVLSIEAQITELRAFARNEGLNIIEEIIEKKSAKTPGRPLFNKMLERIEAGEANAILSWHPDRLARNSVDGGKIIYLLDCGHIVALKFPTYNIDNTSQGKFMLSIAFGQSKYYIDALSENTKRGLRQKVRRGEYPGPAPTGYINDLRSKTIVIDKRKGPIVRRAFELYAQGNTSYEGLADFLAQNGLVSRGNKPLHRNRISFILNNPFYTGLFRYNGEVHEGIHQPVVPKKIFDQVQEVLKARSNPRHFHPDHPQAYCGLMKCATCGMAITAEHKVKHQKNGNTHDYVYYHCTRKNKMLKHIAPCVRQEKLDEQLSSILQKFSLEPVWEQGLLKLMSEEQSSVSSQTNSAFVQESKQEILKTTQKLEVLLDSYLNQDFERETYLRKKSELLSSKKSIEEHLVSLAQKQTGWLEPMTKWIKEAAELPKIATGNDLVLKKSELLKIFGSNLCLSEKAVGEKAGFAASEQWAAVAAAHQNISKMSEGSLLVPMEGFEPPTVRFEGGCSIQLSYIGQSVLQEIIPNPY